MLPSILAIPLLQQDICRYGERTYFDIIMMITQPTYSFLLCEGKRYNNHKTKGY